MHVIPLLFVLTVVFIISAIVFLHISTSLWADLSSIGKPSAPFVPLRRGALAAALTHIDIEPSSVVYDLGCGDGRILQELHKKEPQATFVGIERGWSPYILAKIRTRKIASEKFKIIRGDMFAYDFSQATIITTYLFPKLLDALLPKIQKEVRPGTLLYSIDFTFSHKEPVKIIDLNRPKESLGKMLFVYQF